MIEERRDGTYYNNKLLGEFKTKIIRTEEDSIGVIVLLEFRNSETEESFFDIFIRNNDFQNPKKFKKHVEELFCINGHSNLVPYTYDANKKEHLEYVIFLYKEFNKTKEKNDA